MSRPRAAKPGSPRPPMPAALLAAALRAQSEGVLIADRALRLVFANDSLATLMGCAAVDLAGRALGDFHADRAEVARLRRWLIRAQPGTSLEGEGFLLHREGHTVAAAWTFDPLFDRRGRLTHIVASYRDQTEKRRLQEALTRAQRLDALGRLAGGVAHDFSNLLSIINAFSESLAARLKHQPAARREATEIRHAGGRAAALTQQLLAFGRRRPFEARPIDLNALVRENAPILHRLVGPAGRVELELAEHAPRVRTDPAQFQQVLLNLVLNARDALGAAGRITIATAVRTIRPGRNRRFTDRPPGRYVMLRVADNGSGMDAETQRHLFEPFFTTKPEGQGTGLGLAVVWGVVEESGGTVHVVSAPGAGSTFEVLLPAV
ncbi:MAG: PAS domain-containing protein [Opitutaceae bacterium]|nr:PAS domain-containing protein [Opitutaceae bacterium]